MSVSFTLLNLFDYFRLDTPRDMIEWKNDGVLDINGWDLRKALVHFARGNATLFEWSNSPVVYLTTDDWAVISEMKDYNILTYLEAKAKASREELDRTLKEWKRGDFRDN